MPAAAVRFSLLTLLILTIAAAILWSIFSTVLVMSFDPSVHGEQTRIGVYGILSFTCIGIGTFMLLALPRNRSLLLGIISRFLVVAGCLGLFVILLGALISGFNSSCVAEGSQIATPQGTVPIERVSVGQIVFSSRPDGLLSYSTVTAVCTHCAASYLLIQLSDGKTLRVTDEHPVATANGWKQAGVLVIGELVVTEDGDCEIELIRHVDEAARVFDLTTEPDHNFFSDGVLVHNKSVFRNINTAGGS